jgi:Uma2 family endonuclease
VINPAQRTSAASAYAGVTYKRAPRPLHFREALKVPESRRHMAMRTLLYQVLSRAFGDRAAVGSDQFVYFRGDDPRRSLAPDAFVRLGATNENFATWKTWERGAPDLAIEIVSQVNRRNDLKLQEYAELGVRELIWFDQEAEVGARLRVWDRHEGDLVERVIEEDRTPSVVLGGTWFIGPSPMDPVSLRLLDAGGQLLLSSEEYEARAREQADLAREQADLAREQADLATERAAQAIKRVAELEAELTRARK